LDPAASGFTKDNHAMRWRIYAGFTGILRSCHKISNMETILNQFQ
jgi:hypothetical protein